MFRQLSMLTPVLSQLHPYQFIDTADISAQAAATTVMATKAHRPPRGSTAVGALSQMLLQRSSSPTHISCSWPLTQD